MASPRLQQILSEGLDTAALVLGENQQRQLLDYLDLLQRWNARFNLTAIRDPEAMVTRHLLDSLVLLPCLRQFYGDALSGSSFIDVGTGAGLPGIPLAIALPDCHFTLLDSNGKKTRFLNQARSTLGLQNIDVIHGRVEAQTPARDYLAVLSRAFASLGDMIDGCHQLSGPDGEFLAMKGQRPDEEIEAVRDRLASLSITDLDVPGLEEARCLVRFTVQPAATRN
jgi:16S rRNA (guanine527-N7)-methyltransferase